FTDIDAYKIVEEVLCINEENIFIRDEENKIFVDVNSLMKKGYISKDEEDFSERLISKLNQTLDDQKLVVSGAISNLVDKKYFENFHEWFQKFNVIMNANDMSFKQKDLKTILNKNSSKSGRRNIFESASVKEIMEIAEFGNQKIGFISETDNDDLSMCSMYRVPLKEGETEKKEYAISMIVDSELMESRGTIHLIRLLQPFIDVLSNGGVIVLDEMDASLHFEIVVSLIRIFNNKEINKNGAQLIFNTHNPIYLDGELLRHDQIVMVEKRKGDMVSEIYSLSDYKLRPEERILKNYLNGKYGALPHMDLEIAFKHILESEANTIESTGE
ncbi:MAG: ATP-binding protein, partial [Lachnospiraceae bacterium]|nr:ATP-binding protein [Lachnospiraceae bacterium]